MGKKEVEEMAEKLDGKAFYRWLVERDKRRVSRFHFLSAKNFRKIIRILLHLTGMHQLKREEEVFIDTQYYNIYRCVVCGYKCTEVGLKWELLKWALGYIILVPLLFLPVPKSYFDLYEGLWMFFFLLHTLGGLQLGLIVRD